VVIARLASGVSSAKNSARPGFRLGCATGSRRFEQHPAGFPVQWRLDWNYPDRRVTVTGQDDLVALLGSTNQLGQLPLGISDGYLHSLPPGMAEASSRI
jgi:hypothetical protein